MSFHIDDEKLLETYRAFDQMEDLEITKLDALPVLDDINIYIYIYIYVYIYICIYIYIYIYTYIYGIYH